MKTEIIHASRITEADQRQLYSLFQRFYANTDYERFRIDLADKDWVIRICENDQIAGFSTQQILTVPWQGHVVNVLFSGDTIVHPNHWNKNLLAGAFGHLFLRIAENSDVPLYWFLISKGFRTYRFLPVFFRNYHPHPSDNGLGMKPLLDRIATFKFREAYDPRTGLIELGEHKDYLIEELSSIPQNRRTDPHISFFEQANPAHASGTELACIAQLSKSNLTPCGERVIESVSVEWHE